MLYIVLFVRFGFFYLGYVVEDDYLLMGVLMVFLVEVYFVYIQFLEDVYIVEVLMEMGSVVRLIKGVVLLVDFDIELVFWILISVSFVLGFEGIW